MARTCRQIVMSGGISISFVDLAVLLFDFDRVYCVPIRLFLVRNGCGPSCGPWRGTRSVVG